ncbi:ABC transporter ATP-binding protein/permease [Patescibacteria group bacterium]|nr:ABC transporter ATP-binding protein/permease [Patescibacteria group bacterium]MBU1722113.1 ABC transporter ATP-binding protein/permease [Patescibacteria group bacterium]MBU1901603.1 ABC transporter ATP-binding protein/permease [Patescibacteria group bacterium]
MFSIISQKIKSMLKNIHVILVLYRSFKAYRKQVLTLTLMGFLSGLLEGIGVNALIPLFSIAMNQGERGQDIISQSIEKLFVFFHVDFNITTLLIFILSIFIVRTLVLLAFYYIKIKISADYEEKTRSELLKKTLNAEWSYLLKQKFGKLETLLITHVQYGANALLSLSTTFMAIVILCTYVVIALNISIIITLGAFILGILSIFVLKPIFVKTKNIGYKAGKALEDVSHFVNQNVLGMKTLKYTGVADKLMQTGNQYFKLLNEYKVKVYIYKNFSPQVLQLISLVFICLLFGLSYQFNYLNFGALIAVIYLVQRMFNYVQQLQTSVHGMSESLSYLDNIIQYGRVLKQHKESIVGDKEFIFKDALSFQNVSFSYDTKNVILNRVNINITQGESVAFIGPSGAGKTTVVDLVLRLFSVDSGMICLDSVPVGDINMKKWRNNIGYVSQDMFLKNDSILNNIIFYDDTITKKDAIAAAKKAYIYDFIMQCEQDFDTMIGERGIALSVGQRQRIVIARMLARKPKILIFDEATSALDNESEQYIQHVINDLKGKVTVIMIAHRLSTVRDVDNIFVLDKGSIIESGHPDVLLQDKQSYFSTLYNMKNNS